MTEKRMAIIQNVCFGVGDYGKANLRFTVYIADGIGASCVFDLTETEKLLLAYQVDDVYKLNGKPVWVKTNGNVGDKIQYSEPCIL